MRRFLEGNQIIAAFVPVDMSGAANNGDWVQLSKYRRLVAVLFKKAGTAGDDPVFTLKQASDNAGTGAKALNFTTLFAKVGTQASTAQFTKVTQAAANTYTDATSAEAEAIIAVEVQAADLDVENGFGWVQLSVPDVGANAQLGCGFYLLLEPTYEVEPSLAAQ